MRARRGIGVRFAVESVFDLERNTKPWPAMWPMACFEQSLLSATREEVRMADEGAQLVPGGDVGEVVGGAPSATR
jgi:hypothetical protein